MTVCRFYLQGYCRNGNACKFEHPPKAGQQGFNNRFGALAGQTSQGMAGRAPDALEYPGLTVEAIQRDLANERPQWILSCYGPGRDAPEQLFGGYPREQSFEEIRWHFEQRAMAGNPQGALNDIQALYQNAQQVIQNALNNTPAAVQYILGAANKHPNRIDICKAAAGGGAFGGAAGAFQKPSAPANPFGAPAPAAPATGVGGFGQPAALGQKPSPFGAPAFGQPAQPAASPFGQPSTLGGTSAFGRPAQAPSAFGQTATLGAKPSPFGAPAFGQPAQPGGAPAFGQSGFGQAAALGPKPSPFGAPAAGASPFGAVSGAGGTTQAGPSPFGQLPQPAQKVHPFGQPATSSPFGQPAAAAPVNPFGRPQQQPAASPFGAPAAAPAPTTAFGQPVSATPFGAPPAAAAAAATTTAPTSTPFGQPSTSAPAAAAAAAGTPAQGPYGPGATRQHPDLSTYSSRAPDGSLRMFKGKPVTYETPKGGGGNAVPMTRNFDGSLVKIWSPNGPPNYTAETEAEPDKYEDPSVQQQWRTFLETGRFAGGVMPEVPPKREFCMWDF